MMMAFDADASSTSRFVDGADAGVDHADLDLVVGELLQRLGEHFGRAAHVGLDDDRQFLDFARLHLLVQLLEREAAGFGQRRFLAPCWSRKMTICLALAVSVTTWKSSPASGSDSRPSTSTGVDGSALRICSPRSFSMARTLPKTAAADEEIADAQRAVAHQHRRHRTASAIELALRCTVPMAGRARIGLQILHIGHQQNHFEQQIEILLACWRKPAP